MKFPYKVTTISVLQTRKVGRELGKAMNTGGVIGLVGDLGAGKTVMADGIFKGGGLSREIVVTSPTFTIINMYHGPREMVHIDLYRLKSADEAIAVGVGDFLWRNSGALVVVEWFDKFEELWPAEFVLCKIDIQGKKEREIFIDRMIRQ